MGESGRPRVFRGFSATAKAAKLEGLDGTSDMLEAGADQVDLTPRSVT